MPTNHREKLAAIRRFDQLIAYLRDEMGWPIAQDSFEDGDDLFFDFTPEELGIDTKNAAKIQEIRRLRPLSTRQPWGIFFVKFEPKRLPVVALRRILSQVALKKRSSANSAERVVWSANDLLFVSNYGEGENRQISFAHFTQSEAKMDLPTLKVLGWDNLDTPLHLDRVAELLTERLSWPDDEEDETEWSRQWRSAFTLVHREVITTSKKLSIELAALARNIRTRINTVLAIETEDGPVSKLMSAFKEALVHDLDEDGFADMYAQTIAYGLLSARVADPSGGTADDIATAMPVTNPFLKELMETFLNVGGRKGKAGKGTALDFDELGVSEVVALLDVANMDAVVRDFGDSNPQEDPVIHFYELFLKEYDAKKRMERGVFYTPRPVVAFIVRSVDELLRAEFGLEDGLADTTTWGEMEKRIDNLDIPDGATPDQAFVQILDPATGTGTFLVEVIDLIHKTMSGKWQAEAHGQKKIEKLWNDYVPEHLLPRLHGYELMMAPYAIAHMKIGLKLYETGYCFESDKRARVFLTNALEPVQDFSGRLAFAIPALAHEAEAVNVIKRDQRYTVVIGNPPYAGHSSNQGAWIIDLEKDYFKVDGQKIKEANSKWLLDDYVKFICFGQNVLKKSGRGLYSYISNHGYIDNPTFRGMRQSLLHAFCRLFILDLHGNLKKRSRADDGSADENVFDIQQGVAIFVAVHEPCAKESGVYHGHLRGSREKKYEHLDQYQISSLAFESIAPIKPFFLLIPQDVSLRAEYEEFESLSSGFPEHSLGVLSKRDGLVVGFSPENVLKKMTYFVNPKIPTETVAEFFGLPVSDKDTWNLERARDELKDVSPNYVRKLMYRPFDFRFIYYHSTVVARTNDRVMRHLFPESENIGFILGRQGMATGSATWDVCFVTNTLCDQNIFRRGGGTVFPMLLMVKDEATMIPSIDANLSRVLHKYRDAIGGTPQTIAWYAYAILNSPSFRRRYSEFLKIDFPHLPFTKNKALFNVLAIRGRELIDFHLMDSVQLDEHGSTLHGSGNFQVEKISYSNETVWIDKAKTRGFGGVPEEVWNFHIGGYQVCNKWLKDRQAKGGKNPRPGRLLTDEDIDHYQKIVVALSETIRIMQEIDEIIDQHGGWPMAFK